jgi:hypothetical protein
MPKHHQNLDHAGLGSNFRKTTCALTAVPGRHQDTESRHEHSSLQSRPKHHGLRFVYCLMHLAVFIWE